MKFCISSDDSAKGGIYKIVNTANGKFYVGSTHSFKSRYRSHCGMLRRGSHHATYLQNSWSKYGPDFFEMHILEICPEEALASREQYYLDTLKPCTPDIGYNVLPTARMPLDNAKKRGMISDSRKGKKLNPETIEKLKIVGKLWKRSSEHIAALRKGLEEKGHTKEHAAAIANAKKGVLTDRMRDSLILRYYEKRPISDRKMLDIICQVSEGESPQDISRNLGLYPNYVAAILRIKKRPIGGYTPLLYRIGYMDSGSTGWRDLLNPEIRAKINTNIEFPEGSDNLLNSAEEHLAFLQNIGLTDGPDN